MASRKKQIRQLARQLFRMSLVDGEVSAERVGGVLEYVEKHRPANTHAVLNEYHRLVAAEIARGQAVIEHAGPVNPSAVAAIVSKLTTRYQRRITPITQRNDALLAGVRVRIGDDVYESSVAGQLQTLAAAATS